MYHSLTKQTMTTLSLYLLLSLLPLLASASKIGVTYTPTATSPNPDLISAYAHKHSISTVRLTDPSPSTVRSFSYSNTTLLISLPNSLIPPFSANASNVETYLFSRIVPFYPRANIAALSLGSDPLSATSDLSDLLLPALRNLRSALDKLSLSKISVSTTLSFITPVTTAFPPSSAELLLPASEVVFKPLLSFLSETNASLCMNLYPYHVYKLRGDVPAGFALFQNYPYEFIDDKVTGVRYRNLFDMMVGAVVGAIFFLFCIHLAAGLQKSSSDTRSVSSCSADMTGSVRTSINFFEFLNYGSVEQGKKEKEVGERKDDKEEDKKEEKEEENPKKFQCLALTRKQRICESLFMSIEDLKAHYKAKHRNYPLDFPCGTCGNYFFTSAEKEHHKLFCSKKTKRAIVD